MWQCYHHYYYIIVPHCCSQQHEQINMQECTHISSGTGKYSVCTNFPSERALLWFPQMCTKWAANNHYRQHKSIAYYLSTGLTACFASNRSHPVIREKRTVKTKKRDSMLQSHFAIKESVKNSTQDAREESVSFSGTVRAFHWPTAEYMVLLNHVPHSSYTCRQDWWSRGIRFTTGWQELGGHSPIQCDSPASDSVAWPTAMMTHKVK